MVVITNIDVISTSFPQIGMYDIISISRKMFNMVIV
nr:MAG TPA: hypothetical protein [Caudoviricetes sp.]